MTFPRKWKQQENQEKQRPKSRKNKGLYDKKCKKIVYELTNGRCFHGNHQHHMSAAEIPAAPSQMGGETAGKIGGKKQPSRSVCKHQQPSAGV